MDSALFLLALVGATPAAEVEPVASDIAVESTGFTLDALDAAIVEHKPEVEACVQAVLTLPLLQRLRISVVADVLDDGRVAAAAVADDVAVTAELRECLSAKIMSWRLPAPSAGSMLRTAMVWDVDTAGVASPQLTSRQRRGGLRKQQVSVVVEAHRKQILHCYERPLKDDHNLGGKLVLRFVIEPNGHTSEASAQVIYGKLGDTPACLEALFREAVFPKPTGGGPVVVSYPFVFTSSLPRRPAQETSRTRPKRTKIQRPQEPRLSPGLCTEAWDNVFGRSASTLPEQPLTTSPSPQTLRF